MMVMENFTNQTNSSGAAVPPMRPPTMAYSCELKVGIRTLEGLTAIVGIIGNLLVCTVIVLQSKKRSPISLYLFSLAAADLGVLVLIFPVFVTRMESIPWPFGAFGCLYVLPASEVFYPASIWTITLIAVSRYTRIVRSPYVRSSPRNNSLRTTKILLSCVWLAAFLVGSLPVFFIVDYKQIQGKWQCWTKWPKRNGLAYKKAYNLIMALVYYFIPLSIIIATYCTIRHKLESSIDFHKRMQKARNSTDSNVIALNIKSRRILTPLVLVFAMLMLPITVVRFLPLFRPNIMQYRHILLLYDIFTFCIVLNSAVDPFIYYIVNSEFRMGLKRLVFCRQNTLRSVSTIQRLSVTLDSANKMVPSCSDDRPIYGTVKEFRQQNDSFVDIKDIEVVECCDVQLDEWCPNGINKELHLEDIFRHLRKEDKNCL